jgi:hypothetical protein
MAALPRVSAAFARSRAPRLPQVMTSTVSGWWTPAPLNIDAMILASVMETIPLVSHELSGSQAWGTTRRTAMDSVLSFCELSLTETSYRISRKG